MSNKTVPPPEQDPPSWSKNPLASAEEKNWPNEESLRGQKSKNDLQWLKVYGISIVIATVIFALLFLASVTAWTLHYLLPEKYEWLTADQLSKIQSIVFSGSLGAIVSGVFKKQLDK